MKFLPVLCLAAQISQAQVIASPVNISKLATDDSGQTVYFSTPLRLRGSNDYPWAKIYTSGPNGFTLFSQANTGMGGPTGYLRNSVSVSGDGSVIAINSSAPCYSESLCAQIDQNFTDILIGGADRQYPGTAQVSRGGRYAMLYREIPEHFAGQTFNPPLGVSRLDLTTGSITPVPACSLEIAADGTCLGTANGNFVLISPSGAQTSLGASGPVAFEKLATDGSFVIYGVGTNAEAPVAEIRIRRLDGSDQMLAEVGEDPTLSADGSELLYRVPVNGAPQAFLLSLKSPGSPWQLTSEPQGLTEAVLSGDGGTIAAATPEGGLITVQIQTGARTVKIGATPAIPAPGALLNNAGSLPLLPSPGSTYSIDVIGATDQSVGGTPPLGFELGGIRVLVDGVPAAMYSVSPAQVTFQVAWETPTGAPGSGPQIHTIAVQAGDPNWEAAVQVSGILAVNPSAVFLGTDLDGKTKLWAIHQNWHGLVTAEDPAAPGEIVNFYATGVGPSPQPLATGAAGPIPPVSVPLPEAGCTWTDYAPPFEPVTFPFIGFAPGIVGYYQVALKVPDDFGFTTLNPQCNGTDGSYTFGGGFAVKPAR